MVLWRIGNHTSLSGDGGLRASGRWHTRGRRVVYCAQTPAAALLEILAHLEIEIGGLPVRYRLLRIDAPEDTAVVQVLTHDLPSDWLENAEATRAIGDGWLASGSSPLLTVPSSIVPETFNVLLNPAHPDARRIVVVRVSEHVVDPRLLT